MNHIGPSTIDVNTLYKSQGKIPRQFLEGCGVPGILIDYLPSLICALKPIQFYSCFISYSHKDEDFAKRLRSCMRDEHLRVWYAPDEMKGGRKVHDQIEQAIRVYDKLLVVLSDDSLKSDWVQQEIYEARQREIAEKSTDSIPNPPRGLRENSALAIQD